MTFSITYFGYGVGFVMLGWMAGIVVNLALQYHHLPHEKTMSAEDLELLMNAFSVDLSDIVSFLIGGFTGLAFAMAASMRILR